MIRGKGKGRVVSVHPWKLVTNLWVKQLLSMAHVSCAECHVCDWTCAIARVVCDTFRFGDIRFYFAVLVCYSAEIKRLIYQCL
jgi:hypothetical protein